MNTKEKVDSALRQIPTPAEREQWLTLSMAYKAAGGTYDVWDQWCQKGEGYNQEENKASWDSFTANGGITEKTLFKTAIDNGWDPKSFSSDAPSTNPVRTLIQTAERRQAQIIPYFTKRGFTLETIKRFHLGFDPCFSLAWTNEPRAIIPYPDEDYYTARRISQPQDPDDKKYLYPKKTQAGKKRVFNKPALQSRIVFITEGQIDAMSIEQCGGAAIGCNDVQQILTEIQAGIRTNAFIIVPDDDSTGREKASKKIEALQNLNFIVKIALLPQGIHDANDFLCKNEDAFRQWIQIQITDLETEYPNLGCRLDSAAVLLNMFEKNVSVERDLIPTGFKRLDEILNGGLFEGLYVIGALSSVGKTTFACQIMDQIAQSGKDVIIFSLEMSVNELIAKSLSRLTTKIASKEKQKRTTRDLLHRHFYEKLQKDELETLRIAKDVYRSYAGNIFIKECETQTQVDWITDQIKQHIERNRKNPVVLIDFLQIIAPEDVRATEKQNTDAIILKLKQTARKFNIPILVISSFNRENYANEVNEASYKESGSIEYTADVLIGLQYKGTGQNNFNLNQAKQQNPRKIEVVILKQRNGEAGAVIDFSFNAKYNLFLEAED